MLLEEKKANDKRFNQLKKALQSAEIANQLQTLAATGTPSTNTALIPQAMPLDEIGEYCVLVKRLLHEIDECQSKLEQSRHRRIWDGVVKVHSAETARFQSASKAFPPSVDDPSFRLWMELEEKIASNIAFTDGEDEHEHSILTPHIMPSPGSPRSYSAWKPEFVSDGRGSGGNYIGRSFSFCQERDQAAIPGIPEPGLETAGLTGRFEPVGQRKKKKRLNQEHKEVSMYRSQRQSQSESTASCQLPDPSQDMVGLIEYGHDPVYGSIPPVHLHDQPQSPQGFYPDVSYTESVTITSGTTSRSEKTDPDSVDALVLSWTTLERDEIVKATVANRAEACEIIH